jgi:hypothetical protein
MPVNKYKFNSCAYWCVEVIKQCKPDITIKCASVNTMLNIKKKFYALSTINNALLQLANDGHLKRESTNMNGETIYIRDAK